MKENLKIQNIQMNSKGFKNKQIKLQLKRNIKKNTGKLNSQFLSKKNLQFLKRNKVIDNSSLKSTIEIVKNSVSLVRVNTMKIYKNFSKGNNNLYIYIKNGLIMNEVMKSHRTLKDEICERSSRWVKNSNKLFCLFSDFSVRVDKSKILSYLVDDRSYMDRVGEFIEYKREGEWMKAKPIFDFWLNRKTKTIQTFFKIKLSKLKNEDEIKRNKASLKICRFIRTAAARNKIQKRIKKIDEDQLTELQKKFNSSLLELEESKSNIKIILEENFVLEDKGFFTFNFYHLFELCERNLTLIFFCSKSVNKQILNYFKTILKVLKIKKVEQRLIFVNISSKLRKLSRNINPALKLLFCRRSLEYFDYALEGQKTLLSVDSFTKHSYDLSKRLNSPIEPNTIYSSEIDQLFLTVFKPKKIKVKSIKPLPKKTRKSLKFNNTMVKRVLRRSDTCNQNINGSVLYKSVDNNRNKKSKLVFELPQINIKKRITNKLNTNWSKKLFNKSVKQKESDKKKTKDDIDKLNDNIFKTEIKFANRKNNNGFEFLLDPVSLQQKVIGSIKELKKELFEFVDEKTFDRINQFLIIFNNRQISITFKIIKNTLEIKNEKHFTMKLNKTYKLLFSSNYEIESVMDLESCLQEFKGRIIIEKYSNFKFKRLIFTLRVDVNIEVNDPVIVSNDNGVELYGSEENVLAEHTKIKWIIHRAVQLSPLYKSNKLKGNFSLSFLEIKKENSITDILFEKQMKKKIPFMLNRKSFTKLFIKSNKYVFISKLKVSVFKNVKFHKFLENLKTEGFVYNFATKEGLIVFPYCLPDKSFVFDILISAEKMNMVVTCLEKLSTYLKSQMTKLDQSNLDSLQRLSKRYKEEEN